MVDSITKAYFTLSLTITVSFLYTEWARKWNELEQNKNGCRGVTRGRGQEGLSLQSEGQPPLKAPPNEMIHCTVYGGWPN